MTTRKPGRPKGSRSKTVANPRYGRLVIRLNPQQRQALEIAADKHTGGSMSAVMLDALEDYILRHGPQAARALILGEMMAQKKIDAEG